MTRASVTKACHHEEMRLAGYGNLRWQMALLAAACCGLTACGARSANMEPSPPVVSETVAPTAIALVCPGNLMDAQFDHVMDGSEFGHPAPQDAIATAAGDGLPEGNDVEVSPTVWHRLDASGRVVVEFRIGLAPDGRYYLDGYKRCSDS